MSNSLIIQDLTVSVAEKIVLKNISLVVKSGETHVIMGPNGSGKSSLALTLMGHPSYQVKNGRVMLGLCNLLSLKTNERAKKGLFLAFQNPIAVEGVSLGQLIFSSYKELRGNNEINIKRIYSQIKKNAKLLGINEEMLERYINDGFSGGEKKKAEMLTVLSLKPKFVIFDEIDSGLDVDALKKVALVIKGQIKKNTGVVLITHNQKLPKIIRPDFVHILRAGEFVKTGSHKLVSEIEEKGYAKI